MNHFNGRGVLVIRNPFKAILSYWNFKNTKSHTKTISGASLRSERFQHFAKTGAQRSSSASCLKTGMIIYIFRWLEVITDWLQYSTDVYCIYYEVIILTEFHSLIIT